uniref:Uncharacterized protein n=1 Tax=Leptobrachium leishanense TaxID=445787 RepID=A0A8C5MI49_9ANUR
NLVLCCSKITPVFSHAQTVVLCFMLHCSLQPTGAKARSTISCSAQSTQH